MEDYTPDEKQTAQLNLLIEILNEAKDVGVEILVVGGYGLDVLYGKLTRDHRDFDMYVHKADREKIENIFTLHGFLATGAIVGEVKKIELMSKNYPNFNIEYGFIENDLNKFTSEEIARYLPKKPVGSLSGVSVLTPSLEGFKKIIEVNQIMAQKNNSPVYKHKEWMDKILKSIEMKYYL